MTLSKATNKWCVITLLLLVATPHVLAESHDNGLQRRIEVYVAALTQMDVSSQVVDSHISFTYKRLSYQIVIDPNLPPLFRLIMPEVWEVEGRTGLIVALRAANNVNMERRLVKVYTDGVTVELAFESMLIDEQAAVAMIQLALDQIAIAGAELSISMMMEDLFQRAEPDEPETKIDDLPENLDGNV